MGQTSSTQATSSPSPTPPALQKSPSNTDTTSACPVDDKSREAWLHAAQAQNPQQAPPPSNPHPMHSGPSAAVSAMLAPHPISPTADASACPVDHKSREAWLKAAQAQQPQSTTDAGPPAAPFRPRITNSRLSTHREVSSIPRAFPDATIHTNAATAAASPSSTSSSSPSSSSAHGSPAQPPQPTTPTTPSPNAQTPSATDIHTSPTGHWVYPSEAQFFNAMARKNHNPRASDMATIIPIHNAVNERTWAEVLRWERGQGGDRCGGPKLVSFEGDASRLTPRARWLGLWGYQRPFDRHDWVVDRCGVRVEYVIDFYEGKRVGGAGAGAGAGAVVERKDASTTAAAAAAAAREGAPSFYLDVRPKLNSWEGVRMRFARFWGWG